MKGRFLSIFLLLFSISLMGQYGVRQSAYDFNKRLGRGINFMGSQINGGFHHPYDFELIRKNYFTHVRLGSRVWQYLGPAPDYTIDSAKLASYKNAVDWALNEDLMVIVDPIHAWDNYNDSDSTVLYKVWEQIATEFASYPVEKVAFELINEPRNKNLNLQRMIKALLQRIRAIPGNQKRIIIVSGQGFPTRVALINALNNNTFPSNDPYLIGTFHYYDPKTFTKQGHYNNGIIHWADGGDNDPEWTETITKFQAVVDADSSWAVANNTIPLPIYNGEYGVDNAAPQADRVRWLWWVRMANEKMGFSQAIWHLYGNSPSGKGLGPWTSTEKNNPLSRTLDQNVLFPYRNRYECEHYSFINFLKQTDASNDSVVFFSPAAAGYHIDINDIYIGRSGTYTVYIRYALDPYGYTNSENYYLSYHNNQLIDSVHFSLPHPPYNQVVNSWGVIGIPVQFQAGQNEKLVFKTDVQSYYSAILLDYIAIAGGKYYDNLYPPTPMGINPLLPQKESTISLYPNPASDIVHLKVDFNQCELFSINGQKLKTGRQKEIDISTFKPGLYIIRIDGYSKKLLVK